MKIQSLDAYALADNSVGVSLRIETGMVDIGTAIAAVLARFNSVSSTLLDSATSEQKAEVVAIFKAAEASVAVPLIDPVDVADAKKAKRTRQPKTNPDAAPAVEPAPEPTGDRRSPVTAEKPSVATITDADLAKACSSTAAIIGPEIVKLVLAEFNVDTVNKISADAREAFLGELKKEVDALYEENAAAEAAKAGV